MLLKRLGPFFAAASMMLLLAGCAGTASLQTADDPVTGAHYASFIGHTDNVGGVRATRADVWVPDGYNPYTGKRHYGLATPNSVGYGYTLGQTLANTAVAGAFGAAGAVGGSAVGALLTRPSNFSVTQYGAQAVATGGSAASNARAGARAFGQGGAGGSAVVNNSNVNNNSNANTNGNTNTIGAPCGNIFGC